MQRIHPGACHPLHGIAATRAIENQSQAALPAHTLMRRAGLAVAKLALAITPHAQRIWVACGPGNNGGDGLEAAMHLQQWGKQPIVTWLNNPTQPPDAAASFQRATLAGVSFSPSAPSDPHLCIDALLGIGTQSREPAGEMAHWLTQMNASGAPILSVDLPTGLNADTGAATLLHAHATHTLSLLTLKPGLFTAQGRQACGAVWLNDLGLAPLLRENTAPNAMLPGRPVPLLRSYASHKGTYGDVAVIGGAPGMTGGALLAATAALHAGAGRVLIALLDGNPLNVDVSQPELMFRSLDALDLQTMAVVCGCGGGSAVHAVLERLLSSPAPMVIDADAINSIATDDHLRALLANRTKKLATTVLTPHPLEAARLLNCSVAQVQQDRLAAATQLAYQFCCTVMLKGSGTVIAAPGKTPIINPTGNAKLATAGTGDVLAGMLGAGLAMKKDPFEAAWHAAYQHGLIADQWPGAQPMVASGLAKHFAG